MVSLTSAAAVHEVKKALEYIDKDDGAFWMPGAQAVATGTREAVVAMENGGLLVLSQAKL